MEAGLGAAPLGQGLTAWGVRWDPGPWAGEGSPGLGQGEAELWVFLGP